MGPDTSHARPRGPANRSRLRLAGACHERAVRTCGAVSGRGESRKQPPATRHRRDKPGKTSGRKRPLPSSRQRTKKARPAELDGLQRRVRHEPTEAAERARTVDLHVGNVSLYQLSYSRVGSRSLTSSPDRVKRKTHNFAPRFAGVLRSGNFCRNQRKAEGGMRKAEGSEGVVGRFDEGPRVASTLARATRDGATAPLLPNSYCLPRRPNHTSADAWFE